MTAHAILDKVIVRVDKDERVSAGGIHLGFGIEREKTLTGTVLSVGEGRLTKKGVRVPPGFAVGARVMFDRSAGWPIPSEPGEELIGLREDWIHCELESEAAE